MNNRQKIMFLILAFILSLFVLACGNATKSDDDFRKKSSDKNKEKSSEEFISELIDDYNSGELGYKEAEEKILEIKKSLDGEDVQVAYNALNTISELKKSKEKYEKGLSDYDYGNYADSISELKAVVEEDSNYDDAQSVLEDAQEKYKDTVFEQIDKYTSENQFEKAKELLNSASYYLNKDDIDKKQESVADAEDKYNEQILATAENEAKAAMESGDYKTAIEKYKQMYEDTSDKTYSVKVEGVENDWINASIASAEEYLSRYEYDEADGALNAAYYNVSDVSRLDAEKERIDSFRPFVIDEAFCSNYLNMVFPTDSLSRCETWHHLIDNLGKEHDGLCLWHDKYYAILNTGSYIKNESCTWNYVINAEYSYFEGIFALQQEYKNTTCNMYLKVYGDGKLLYESDILTSGVTPIDFSVNVSDVYKLSVTIEMKNENMDSDFGCGVVDMALKKEYTPLG